MTHIVAWLILIAFGLMILLTEEGRFCILIALYVVGIIGFALALTWSLTTLFG